MRARPSVPVALCLADHSCQSIPFARGLSGDGPRTGVALGTPRDPPQVLQGEGDDDTEVFIDAATVARGGFE